MITRTLVETTVPDSDIVVTVVEDVIRHVEPRFVRYTACAEGLDPRNGEWFTKSFVGGSSQEAATQAARNMWKRWARIAKEVSQ